jgi:acylglycerol lipase
MNKIFKKALYFFISVVAAVFILGLILAFLPTKSKTNHVGISPEEAAQLRQYYH